MPAIPENKSIKRIFFRAIKAAVKTPILYYFLMEAEPGNEKTRNFQFVGCIKAV